MNNNIKNDLKHLSFEEYFQGDWRKHFQEEETVKNIMDASGLSSSHDFVQINTTYLIDDNRIAVIVLIKRKNSLNLVKLEKLIVDVIAGNSSFEQLYDVVYNVGADCDYRMIICDWHSKNKTSGLWMTDDIMCRLISHFDRHLSLYWICADALKDIDGTGKIVYTVMGSVAKSDSSFDLPSRRDLECAELMFYTWQASGYFSSEHDYPLNFSNCYEDESSKAEWTDNGIITEVTMSEDEYEWLMAHKPEEIFNDGSVHEYYRDIQTLMITEYIPFQNFSYSLPEDKRDLAEHFYRNARIGSWIDEFLCEEDTEEPESKTTMTVPLSDLLCPQKTPVNDDIKENDDTKPITYPSVTESLGSNWKKYFLKRKTIKEIIRAVEGQDKLNSTHRKGQRNKASDKAIDLIAYDFIEVNDVAQLGENWQRITATFMNIESGLFEKWSIDVSPAPICDQALYALYDLENSCTKKIFLYFKDYKENNETDPEIKIENESAENILFNASSYADSINIIWATVTDSDGKKGKFEISIFMGLISDKRGQIPSQSVFESEIWDSYFYKYIYHSTLKDSKEQHPILVTGFDYPYSKIPFCVWPEWTDKGLFIRLYANHDCPETNWLLKFKMNELARRYNGNDLQRVMEPSIHYSIVIHLHESPVSDFIESSALAKFNYASDVRKQQLDMIRHIEEIFQDYVPEETLSE